MVQDQAEIEHYGSATQAIIGIGEAYHPHDPSSAQVLPAVEVEQRLIKSFVATVAFFHLQVQLWVSQLALSPEVQWMVINELIPALYLERAAKKLSTADYR
jgi:hypothetical protein